MFKKVLFLGGSKDGQWFEVDASEPRIMMVKENKHLPLYIKDVDFTKITVENEIYKSNFIQSEKEMHQLYVLDSISSDEMMKMLINGYLQPKGI